MSLYAFDCSGTVEFYDCDPMGVVWHGNYVRYLESARGRFLDMIGYPYAEIDRDGFAFPIVELRLKYTGSLRLRDCYTVTTHLDEYENRLVHSFEVRSGERLCLRARSVQVCVPRGGDSLTFCMPGRFVSCVRTFLAEAGHAVG